MIDTSKFNLDTPVYIKIMNSGIYIPEFETYTPFESYASIEQVISILNRGIEVEFPKQSSQLEISKKIEEIMLDYEEAKIIAKEKKNIAVGTNIDKALETIQNINDSNEAPDEYIENRERVFDFKTAQDRIVRNLSDTHFTQLLNSDDFVKAEDRLYAAEMSRKNKAIIKDRRKEALQLATLEAETLRKLSQDAKYEQAIAEEEAIKIEENKK